MEWSSLLCAMGLDHDADSSKTSGALRVWQKRKERNIMDRSDATSVMRRADSESSKESVQEEHSCCNEDTTQSAGLLVL